jgi:hypothetical protein
MCTPNRLSGMSGYNTPVTADAALNQVIRR